MVEALLLSLDLGTTVLAGRLTTAAGEVLAEIQGDNPQKAYGADVIRRLEAARAGHGAELQQLLAQGIRELVGQLLVASGAAAGQISTAAAAANPAITHLLAGRPVERLLFPPHRPEFTAGEDFEAAELDLGLPVPLYLFPLPGAHVGGDLLAVLLAAGPPAVPSLVIDLGTNAELALWDGRHWLVTSVAAGPAFEADHLGCGMRHVPGAVAQVCCVNDRFQLDVVGGGAPLGVCGSGLFSALSAARNAGLIDPSGRIRDVAEIESPFSRFVVTTAAGSALQLYRDAERRLLISQKDIRAFQLAKGAVAAGVACLLQRSGLESAAIGRVTLCGALGTALPPTALKGVAMLPENMLEKVRFRPAAVLDGVAAMQCAPAGAAQVQRLAGELQIYPLSGTPAFEHWFLRSLDFA